MNWEFRSLIKQYNGMTEGFEKCSHDFGDADVEAQYQIHIHIVR